MHIVLLQYYPNPNPDYANMANGLRVRGHTVWLGQQYPEGMLEVRDGEQIVIWQSELPAKMQRVRGLPGLSYIRNRVMFLIFILQIQKILRHVSPDIVQIDPGAFLFPWLFPLFMPKSIAFILDVKQINVGVHKSLFGRLKELQLILSWKISARFVYDHTFFDYDLAAKKLLGKQWFRWATVVPVGINDCFLTINNDLRLISHNKGNVRFIYVGTINRFRELENLFLAASQLLTVTDRFEMVFVGPDKSNGYYHRLIQELGIQHVVRIAPPVPNEAIANLMVEFDVGLAYVPERPTWHYQPTIKVLEYRALGLPILSSDVLSHHDFVEQEVNGLLVHNSVESLVVGMHRFVSNHTFLQQCRQNALKMRSGNTIEKIAQMHENKYCHLKKS